jgi:hypothetical protein
MLSTSESLAPSWQIRYCILHSQIENADCIGDELVLLVNSGLTHSGFQKGGTQSASKRLYTEMFQQMERRHEIPIVVLSVGRSRLPRPGANEVSRVPLRYCNLKVAMIVHGSIEGMRDSLQSPTVSPIDRKPVALSQ